jgi:choline-sulfatase
VTCRARFAALLLAACAPGLSSCSRTHAPDIVVVTLDTVRADRLGCYGSRLGLTPHLDAFASEAVVFEDVSCSTPVTLPSHATLFTGRYPTATGVRNNGSFAVPASETTMAEALRAGGWRTGAVIAAYPLQSRYGLAQGFDVYDEDLPPIAATGGGAFSVHFSERDARAVTDRALDLWSRLAGKPRFLWVHYFDAHAPYTPPEPFAASHAGAPYDGEIAYVDAELGRLLERVARDAPRAIVVIAADHGESLGEHGEKTHGIFLYQSTVGVPLVIRAPGRWPAGGRVSIPVSLADVFPTVLKLAGVEVPGPVDGADLAPAVGGTLATGREVYAESFLPLLQFRFSPLTMLRSGPLKYIGAPAPEIYDVRGDPSESRNLAGSSPDQAALAERLTAFVARSDPDAAERATSGLDAESEARLRSLGYAAAGTLARPDAGAGRDPKTMTDYLQRYDRAVGLVSAGRIDEGLEGLRALLPEAPENYMARYQLAAGLLAAGRAAEARAELEKVVAAAPEFGSGYLMLAECLLAEGRLDDAVRSFDTAALRLPTQAEPRVAKGRALESRGRFDAAADAYREAVEREPGATEAARALIALRAGRGDLARADVEIATLADRFPTSAALATGHAELRHRLGDNAGAAAALKRALELDPRGTEPRLLQAALLLEAGRPSEAAAVYRSVLRDRPDSRVAGVGLGRALVAGGPDADAEAWISRLEAADPTGATPRALRGALFERRGDTQAAMQAYREALAADPRDADARRGMARLSGSAPH